MTSTISSSKKVLDETTEPSQECRISTARNKRTRGGPLRIEERALVAKTKNLSDKYSLLLTIQSRYADAVASLCASDQTFYHCANRVIRCVDSCHNGDLSTFLSVRKTLALSRFKCDACSEKRK